MRVCCLVGLLALVVLTPGCGKPDGPPTYRVSGKVTLDGQPVTDGRITFKDPDGQAKSMATDVKAGTYSFYCTAGQKKIEVTWLRKVEGKQYRIGGNPGDPVGPNNPADVFEEAIPSKFNTQTMLTGEIKSSGGNTFDFDLKSK